ncbi:MAG TPA: hypothetical protein VKE88_00990, partial [Candidatus Nanoarchaeia archaeon]|nr:hypothetical protein [Candidatus Nanoarchaeia archaeon]
DGIKQIFKIHTARMKLSKVDTNFICKKMEGMSGAEIRAVCTEAGYFAIRSNRTTVNKQDFDSAVEKVLSSEKTEGNDFMGMFG